MSGDPAKRHDKGTPARSWLCFKCASRMLIKHVSVLQLAPRGLRCLEQLPDHLARRLHLPALLRRVERRELPVDLEYTHTHAGQTDVRVKVKSPGRLNRIATPAHPHPLASTEIGRWTGRQAG